MSIIHGKSIVVKVGNTAVAAAKSCTISVQGDLIETSSPSDGTWKTYLAGRKEWDVTCDYLVTEVEDLLEAVDGTAVTLTIGTSTDYVSGTAYCTNAEVSGSIGALAKGSFRFKGTGALT